VTKRARYTLITVVKSLRMTPYKEESGSHPLSQTLNLGDSDKHASLLQHSLITIVKSFIEIKCDLLNKI
jgi:hypothetical protein